MNFGLPYDEKPTTMQKSTQFTVSLCRVNAKDPTPTSCRRAFLILELLIGLLIVSIGATALSRWYSYCMQNIFDARMRLSAFVIASSAVEKIFAGMHEFSQTDDRFALQVRRKTTSYPQVELYAVEVSWHDHKQKKSLTYCTGVLR